VESGYALLEISLSLFIFSDCQQDLSKGMDSFGRIFEIVFLG